MASQYDHYVKAEAALADLAANIHANQGTLSQGQVQAMQASALYALAHATLANYPGATPMPDPVAVPEKRAPKGYT